jgi:hypothetical protein
MPHTLILEVKWIGEADVSKSAAVQAARYYWFKEGHNVTVL